MIVTIFRIRMRPDADLREYGELGGELLAQAREIPGFVSLRSYTSTEGENLALIEFENEEALEQWRQHPGHMSAKELGRTRFYSDLHVQICQTIDEYSHKYS
ncbi:MAG: antibiotic biosynthesis monooxygenase [Pseudomonadales bacterium]|nr:antibiotic biosynthesis monooxygenase [Pseudomonadales bacterium]MCP5184396.1 antibiotic biosynthesis monooxygenase [Pseudomonadales bacterium]